MTASLAKIGVLVLLVAAVSGCGVRDRLFGGNDNRRVALPYEARLTTGETRRDFTVTVAAAGASLEEVRESARYPATAHCLENAGGSDIAWVIDPATGDWQVQRTEDGDLIVQGRCSAR